MPYRDRGCSGEVQVQVQVEVQVQVQVQVQTANTQKVHKYMRRSCTILPLQSTR